jgi:hypothetical protein
MTKLFVKVKIIKNQSVLKRDFVKVQKLYNFVVLFNFSNNNYFRESLDNINITY